MTRWDQSGTPHKGWTCIDVEDLGEAGPIEEGGYANCEMCGNEKIRYVHVMIHTEFSGQRRVGCVCAGKMSDDYVGPERRERKLRNRAAQRAKWLTRKWRTSNKGNPHLNAAGMNLGVYQAGGGWKYRIDGDFSQGSYSTADQAKLALFDAFWLRTSGKKP